MLRWLSGFYTFYNIEKSFLDYNVTEWGGKKLFVVQANGRMGPKAMFQVYAFFVLGLFLLVCGCFMAIVEFSPCLVESVRSMMERVQPPDIGGI